MTSQVRLILLQKSYIDGYETTSNMVCQNVKQKLHNMTYSNNDDFPNYITIIHNK